MMTYQTPEMTIVFLQDEDVLTLSVYRDENDLEISNVIFGLDI